MAEEKHEENGLQHLLMFFAGFAALVAVWWFTGGPQRADLRGIFLEPPQPLGGGNAYGPGATTTPPAVYETTSTYDSGSTTNYQYDGSYQSN